MFNDSLRKIYSRHGLSGLGKTVEIMEAVDDILVEIIDKDKSEQDQFLNSIKSVLDKYKPKARP